MHCRMFSSIPGLHPLDASSIAPCTYTKNVSGHSQVSPGQNLPWLRTTDLDHDMFGALCVHEYVCVHYLMLKVFGGKLRKLDTRGCREWD